MTDGGGSESPLQGSTDQHVYKSFWSTAYIGKATVLTSLHFHWHTYKSIINKHRGVTNH